jgi:hypothetical protein
MRKRFSVFAEAPRFFGKAIFKGDGLFEAVSLHDAAPFLGRRERLWRSHHR